MDVQTNQQGRWKKWLSIGCVAAGLAVGSIGAAQDKEPAKKDDKGPMLPPTKVEGKTKTDAPVVAPPEPAVMPPPDVPPDAEPVATPDQPSIATGGIFSSPPVTGYNAGQSTTGTLFSVPGLDFPGVVNVVPQAVIRDQSILRVDDVLRDIPGAAKFGDFRRTDAFSVRGFELRSGDYRWNGFRDQTFATRDFANIQRFEVLKGPASVLYGGGQPGGVVNILTKQPQSQAYNALNFTGGSYGLRRTTVDSTGPLDDNGEFLYRVNAAYEYRDSFRDFGFLERTFAAPAFTWVIDDNNALTFEGSYLNERRRFDSGLAVINGNVNALPINRYLNEPNDFQRFNDYKTSAKWTHRYDNDWYGNLGFFANWYDAPSSGTVPILAGNSPSLSPINFGSSTLLRQVQATPRFKEQYYSVIGNIAGKAETGPVMHNLVFGTELGWFQSFNFTGQLSDPLNLNFLPGVPFPIPSPSSPINAFNPQYGQPQPPLVGQYQSDFTSYRYGFYAQDLMDLTPEWKLLAGIRGDIADTHFARQFSSPFGGQDFLGYNRTVTDATYYRFTPRVGLVYEPLPKELSLYTSYSTSFDPPAGGVYRNANPLKPETGHTIEAGVKWDVIDQRLSLIASSFYIVKDNVTTQDSFLFSTQIGQQRSQGVELSAVGQVTDSLSIITNYAYIDSRSFDDTTPAINGKRFRGVPYNSANAWVRYNLVDDGCQTLGVAAGIVFLGERAGDLQNSFNLPGYTRYDAGVFYNRGLLNAQVYLENLFDRRYYSSSIDQFSVFPGTPFNMRATVGIQF